MARSFVLILATRELLAKLANNPIMLGRLIQLFRHLEFKNPSIISDSIDKARWCNNSRGAGAEIGAAEEKETEYT